MPGAPRPYAPLVTLAEPIPVVPLRNPRAWTSLVIGVALVGIGDPAEREQLAAKLPTGAVVTMSFDGPWAILRPGSAVLDHLFMPRSPRG